MVINPIRAHLQDPTRDAARKATAIHERLRRGYSDSDEANARRRQREAADALRKAKTIDDPRGAALVAVLTSIVERDAAAFAELARREEVLTEAEAAYRAALTAATAADERYAAGTLDPDEAVGLFMDREHAHAALRARDRELAEAQRPTRLPAEVGLPPAARRAEKDSERLGDLFRRHGLALDDGGPFARGSGVSVARIAQEQGLFAAPDLAVWWPLYEAKDAAPAFAVRAQEYERAQNMSEADLRDARRNWR